MSSICAQWISLKNNLRTHPFINTEVNFHITFLAKWGVTHLRSFFCVCGYPEINFRSIRKVFFWFPRVVIHHQGWLSI